MRGNEFPSYMGEMHPCSRMVSVQCKFSYLQTPQNTPCSAHAEFPEGKSICWVLVQQVTSLPQLIYGHPLLSNPQKPNLRTTHYQGEENKSP